MFGFSSRIEFDIFFREKITKPHLYPEESAPLNAQENTDRICTQKGAPLKSQNKNQAASAPNKKRNATQLTEKTKTSNRTSFRITKSQ